MEGTCNDCTNRGSRTLPEELVGLLEKYFPGDPQSALAALKDAMGSYMLMEMSDSESDGIDFRMYNYAVDYFERLVNA